MQRIVPLFGESFQGVGLEDLECAACCVLDQARKIFPCSYTTNSLHDSEIEIQLSQLEKIVNKINYMFLIGTC